MRCCGCTGGCVGSNSLLWCQGSCLAVPGSHWLMWVWIKSSDSHMNMNTYPLFHRDTSPGLRDWILNWNAKLETVFFFQNFLFVFGPHPSMPRAYFWLCLQGTLIAGSCGYVGARDHTLVLWRQVTYLLNYCPGHFLQTFNGISSLSILDAYVVLGCTKPFWFLKLRI